jgi:cell division protein FtsN
MGNRYIYKSNASRKSSNRTKKTGDNLTNSSTVSYENNQSKGYMIMFLRVIIFFVIILVVIIGGYFAGQYFYIQKIKPQNISQTSLIAPLISEKKNIDYNTNNPTSNEYVLIPKLNDKLNDKKTDNKETNLKQNEKTITTNTLTTNSNEINTNKTETKEDQKILENLKSIENSKTLESSLKDTPENINSTEANNEKNNLNKDINKKEENQNNTNNNILPDSEGNYYIQVGLFSVYNNAKYVSETLKNKGIYCSIDEVIIKNTKMYRVIVGPFKNMDKANEISKIIENEGFNPLVRKF